MLFGPSRQGRSKSGRPSEAAGAAENLKRPLVDHLDAILTSVGSKHQLGRFWSGEFFRQGEIDLPKLHRGESVKKWDWLRAETAKTLKSAVAKVPVPIFSVEPSVTACDRIAEIANKVAGAIRAAQSTQGRELGASWSVSLNPLVISPLAAITSGWGRC